MNSERSGAAIKKSHDFILFSLNTMTIWCKKLVFGCRCLPRGITTYPTRLEARDLYRFVFSSSFYSQFRVSRQASIPTNQLHWQNATRIEQKRCSKNKLLRCKNIKRISPEKLIVLLFRSCIQNLICMTTGFPLQVSPVSCPKNFWNIL